MEVLWLKSQNTPHKKICQLARITALRAEKSENTLITYLEDYLEGGIEKLKEINFYRPQSELELHRGTIKEYFEKNPPATINEAIYKIEELTGIKRSHTQVRKFLKSMGMKCLKMGSLPSKANPDEQEEYRKTKLEPRLNEAKERKRAVFFVDAAHFSNGSFFGFCLVF